MLVVPAGIMGVHAVLFATSMCIIFVNIIDEQNVFTHWFTYLVSPCKFEALLRRLLATCQAVSVLHPAV